MIAGQIPERPAFLEVYLDQNQLFYRPISKSDEAATEEKAAEEKAAGVLLSSN